MKKILSKILKKAIEELEEPFAKFEFSLEEIESKIEIPPSIEMGDFAFPCFVLASKLKSAPHDIALALRAKIGQPKKFSDIQTSGAYLNFFIDRKSLALNILKEIEKQKDNFGRNQIPPEKIMVEFPSPNTNKPLHLGHLRNMAIGESVSRILEFSNAKVIRVNLNNDRGIHICKSMLAYSKWGKNKKPSKKIKSDKLVGDFYVMFNNKLKKNKDLEIEVHEMLRKWEAGDKKTIALWKKMNKWAFDGFKKTYQNFGIKHDREYFESEIYTKGREIIIKGVEQILVVKRDKDFVIVTLGTNLKEITALKEVNKDKTISNDFYEVTEIYGIEVARELLMNEIKEVLKSQGLDIDIRHLKLVTDAMTNSGEIKGVTRMGIIAQKSSILARATFETPVPQFVKATIKGGRDKLLSVIENIILNQPVPVGTGLPGLLVRVIGPLTKKEADKKTADSKIVEKVNK